MAIQSRAYEVSFNHHRGVYNPGRREQGNRRGTYLARRGIPVREIRQTVPTEAMLQVSKIRPHRNPVQSEHSMWLLCRTAQLERLPHQGRQVRHKEMCCVQGSTRGVE